MRILKIRHYTIIIMAAVLTISAIGCAGKRAGKFDDPYNTGIGDSTMFDEYDPSSMSGVRFETLQEVDVGQIAFVYFAYNNYSIPSTELKKIETVAALLQNNPSLVLLIEGHCDERGTHEYNVSLGEYRAQSVRNYLINYGISANRIQTSSFGKERPIDPAHTESAWSRNRRAEFHFYRH